jgi:tryptophan 2,3-dioxygenase
MHYSDYLQLEKILGAQAPESDNQGGPAHDEMLFIVIHQTYELWFKQLLHEANSIIEIMQKPALNDNSPELQTVVHRLSRMGTILRVLVHQIDIMETMTPMDFLDFRDLLRPASGFQSVQFKVLEANLGLKYEQRHGQEHYISQLKPAEVDTVKKGEAGNSLLSLVNEWLERTPFFIEDENWKGFVVSTPLHDLHPFWAEYRERYRQSLNEAEKNNLEYFDSYFFEREAQLKNTGAAESAAGLRSLSPAASRAALFIMLYRGYPMLQLPFQLLNNLLEIDEQLSTWRYRHMSMVHRMIGTRIGTGGSSGRDYLRSALEKHYIFRDIAQLTSFLIERKKLPQLSSTMERRLGFVQ